MFIGRKEELKELEKFYGSEGFQVITVYGNAGAGKTTLVNEFCKNKKTIFFTASQVSSRSNLDKFSKVIASFYKEGQEKNETLNFQLWESALNYIKSKSQDSRIILVIDEFTRISERDAAFLTVLYNTIENDLNKSNMFLILISRETKFIQKNILTKNIPLASVISGNLFIQSFMTSETVEKLKELALQRSQAYSGFEFIKFSADEVLIREDEVNLEMYKIISGTAVCYINYGTENEYVLGIVKEDEILGEFSVVTGNPSLVTFVAFSDLLVLRIWKNDINKFISINSVNVIDIVKSQEEMLKGFKIHLNMLINEIKETAKEYKHDKEKDKQKLEGLKSHVNTLLEEKGKQL